MLRRLTLLTRLAAPTDRVLLVGDDDLTSLCLHWLGYQKLTLVDFDRELLDIVCAESKKKVVTVVHDLRGAYRGSFPALGKGFDLFLTDPPYGPDGLRVFAGVGLGALAPGAHGVIVAPAERVAGSSVRDPLGLAVALQAFVTKNGAALVDIEPNSQRSYHGTVSSMLVVRRVGRRAVDFSGLGGPKEFY